MSSSRRRAPSDVYEAEHMPAEGNVIYRSKQVSRLLALIPMVFALFFAVASGLLATGVIPQVPRLLSLVPLALFAFMAFLGLTMSGLRTVLTSDELRIQHGLWGPRIALDAIESCRVVDYDQRKYGGYGLKIRNGVRIYSMPGSERAIALRYTTESGDARQLVLTADDPVALAGEIQKARKARIAAGGRQRIDVDGAPAEQEALAAEEQLSAEGQERERASGSR